VVRIASIVGGSRWRQVFCTVLLSTIILVALHSHVCADPLTDQPLNGGHHCLVCIAAHLPSATSNVMAVPLPPSSCHVAVASTDSVLHRETQIAFSLYMRPPPLA